MTCDFFATIKCLKMPTKKLNIYLFFLVLFFIISCQPEKKEQDEEEDVLKGTLVKIDDKLFSIPSHVEMSILLNKSNAEIQKDLLNPLSNSDRYNTSFKRALNIGIYGADLGYLNVYKQESDAILYFKKIKEMIEELGIYHTVDKKIVKRVENNRENPDSLMYIFNEMFQHADAYLMDNNQKDISILILTGGWIESNYILTKISQHNKDQLLLNRVAEQKYPLQDIIALMRPYHNKMSLEFDRLLQRLINLAYVYDGIKTEYIYKKPDIHTEEKVTEIKSETKSVIEDYHLQAISDSIQSIRNEIVK